MARSKMRKPVTDSSVNGLHGDQLGGKITDQIKADATPRQVLKSKWRDEFKVHPAADVFPMMSDDELAELGEDIKAKGLLKAILVWDGGDGLVLVDGRNRLEAMERVGLTVGAPGLQQITDDDPVPLIISLNIRRRHLTKQQQADLIVAAVRASRQNGEVRKRHVKGKAGSVKDADKAEAVTVAKQHGIGQRTVERSFAKAEGREPKPYAARPLPRPRSGKPVVGLEAARRHYLDLCADPDVDLDAEQRVIIEAFREIAGKCISAAGADLAIPDFLKRPKDAGHV